MFIGVYELDGVVNYGIYYKNGGYDIWFKETFSPETNIIGVLDLQVKGKNYAEKKAYAEDLAKEYQLYYADYSWSYGELAEIQGYFEKIGKRYGLLKVFKENAIC